jgi:hypothetical protein
MGRIGAHPAGCEETEFCIRAQRQLSHFTLLYHPQARVHHKVPENRQSWAYFIRRCYAEGLSKAQVTHLVGIGEGLASERKYTRQTLPNSILRGLAEAWQKGDLAGLTRSAAIVAGLAFTVAGYLTGSIIQLIAIGTKTPIAKQENQANIVTAPFQKDTRAILVEGGHPDGRH